MSERTENLFKDFKSVSKKEWAEKAARDLKNEDVFDKYNWNFEDDLTLHPYYDESDLSEIKSFENFQNRLLLKDNPTGESRYWENIQKIIVGDSSSANKEALNALSSGADGVTFDLTNVKEASFDALLENILIDYCNVSFIQNSSQNHLEEYQNYLSNKEVGVQAIKGFFLSNNSDNHALLGAFKQAINYPGLKSTVLLSEKKGPSEQVADLLHQAVNAIDTITSDGLDPKLAIDNLAIVIHLSNDYFGEMARIRAIRNLFFQLAQAYQVGDFKPEDLYIHCISPAWTDEKYQPHANMLKSTTAAMAAILGGCDSLTVEPEDHNNPLMVRIARNVSLVLKEESFFNKTVDPVAGAYFIEVLCDKIAQKAWKSFQTKLA